MVNVLIVEDSRVVSEYLYYIFSKDPQIQVVGNVSNGRMAVDFLRDHKPDVITMDIDMPIMNGLEATRIIMSTNPVPILIVTASRNAQEVSTSIEAMAAGALAVIEKPVGIGHPKEEELAGRLLNMVKLMAGVKVVKRKAKAPAAAPRNPAVPRPGLMPGTLRIPEVVAIGVSSGGPQALQKVFAGISAKFPSPILVVQHIAAGFLDGLVNWLGNSAQIPLKIAEDGEKLLSGQVYFAPDHHHMCVTRNGRIQLLKASVNGGICPSVANLYKSVNEVYGNAACGIILTGMGSDGAQELKYMEESGALTIAQSKESSLIFGMPGVAVQLGAARYVLDAEEIGSVLVEMETSNRR